MRGRHHGALLVGRPDGWYLVSSSGKDVCLGALSMPVATFSETLVGSVASSHRSRIAILLDSSAILHSSFDQSEIGHKRNHRTLLYRLESDLPLSAEDTLADFCFERSQANRRVAGFAVQKHLLTPLLVLLRASNIDVVCVTGRTLALIQSLIDDRRLPASCLVLTTEDDPGKAAYQELFRIENGVLTDWRLPNDSEALAGDIRMLQLDSEQLPKIAICNSLGMADEAIRDADWERLPVDIQAAENDAGWEILAGRKRPWFNLLRDPTLAFGNGQGPRQSLIRMALVAAACCLVASGVLLWRASRIDQESLRVQEQQLAVFRETFPDQQPPTAILKRFQSEYAKILGARRSTDTTFERPRQAMPVVHAILQGIPRDLDLSIEELRVSDGEFYLDLRLTEHEDAAALATALGQQQIQLSPPTTEYSGNSVRTVLRGRIGSVRP